MQKRSNLTRAFRTRASWLLLILSAVLICDVGFGAASAQMGFSRVGGGFGPVNFGRGGFGPGGFGPASFGPRGFGGGPRGGLSGPMFRGADVLRHGRDTGRFVRNVNGPGRGGLEPGRRTFERGPHVVVPQGRTFDRRLSRRFAILPRRPRLPNPSEAPPAQVQSGPPRQLPRPPVRTVLSSSTVLVAPIEPPFDLPVLDERRYVPNEILVTTNAQLSSAGLQRVERRFGLTPLASTRVKLLGLEIRRYRLSDRSSVRGSILALRSDPDIRSAQPNFLFALQEDTKPKRQALADKAANTDRADSLDPAKPIAVERGPVQYAIDAMKLGAAHKMETGAGVLIAIIDTGLDETHPEIAGRVADRFDAVGGKFRPHSHGTAMAGVIVAHKDLIGIAPDARLLAIRAFESLSTGSGQGTSYDIVRGLDFAVSHGAQIVNMSFAGPRDALFGEALAAARQQGVVEIAAAGNAGPDAKPLFPGAEPGVIAITATDQHNMLFALANRGDYVSVAAPGVDVIAPSTGGAMQLTSGTSVAAAEASGVVALLLEAHPNASADLVRKVLRETAAHPGAPTAPGAGQAQQVALIDALAAVQAVSR